MADEDSHSTYSSVSRNEGHSDPLRLAAEARAILRTPAKAYRQRIYLATLVKTQNCTKMLTNVTFFVQIAYFCMRPNNRKEKQKRVFGFSLQRAAFEQLSEKSRATCGKP